MKNLLKISASAGLLAMLFATGCKKKDVDPTVGFSAQIQQIVPQSVLDTLKKKGMTIHQGTVPPKIEGIFWNRPSVLISPYGPNDSYKVGEEFADIKYKFYEQSVDNQSVKFDSKELFTSTSGTGTGSFVSGNGNLFTVFAEVSKQRGSLLTYKTIEVISGEITSTGIKNFQSAFVMKSKNGDDNNSVLVAVGLGRTFKDGDGLAEKVSSFKIGVSEEAATGSTKGQADN